MTTSMLRRIARLEGAGRASRIVVVKDYGDTDVQAEIVRQLGGPAHDNDLVVVLRKFSGPRPGRALQ